MTPVTRNCVSPRMTVEELAVDCIDVREALKAGVLEGPWLILGPGSGGPRSGKLRPRDSAF
jgi:hypothetical protein